MSASVYKRSFGYDRIVPRPKTRSDEDLLDAAFALARERGVDRLTFAAVAEASGLSAATLVQRFGSKAALKQRALLRAWDQLDERTRELAASVPKTPEGAIELLIGLSGDYERIDRYAEDLLILREDLRDPVLRSRGGQWERELVLALDACFGDGPRGVGHLLAAHWQGAVTWWAFSPDRRLDEHLRASLAQLVALLRPA
jgi:AcrR family transcriptional regulator